MARKILIALLSISLLLEAVLTATSFFFPARVVASMHMAYSRELALPVFLIGWFLLLVTMLIAWLIYAVVKDLPGHRPFLYILATWWIGIGIGIYLFSGVPNNLLSDSLKGALLILAARLQKR